MRCLSIAEAAAMLARADAGGAVVRIGDRYYALVAKSERTTGASSVRYVWCKWTHAATRPGLKGVDVLFVTSYRLTGERSKARTTELMTLFGARGPAPGTIAHYVYADGGGGFVVTDETGLTRLYEDAVNYSPYVEFSTRPALTIDDAVPTITGWMSG